MKPDWRDIRISSVMSFPTRKRPLQTAIAILCAVPLTASLMGVVGGPAAFEPGPFAADVDSHFRYLSGIFLGVAIGFLTCIPNVEAKTARFRLLAAFVVLGGFARLLSLILIGPPTWPHLVGLGIELGVMPLLVLWQDLVRRAG